jgi:hypothetical protein
MIAEQCLPGTWAIDPYGQVCMIEHAPRFSTNLGTEWVIVKYGAAGPTSRFQIRNLKTANEADVKEAGLEGVGGRFA